MCIESFGFHTSNQLAVLISRADGNPLSKAKSKVKELNANLFKTIVTIAAYIPLIGSIIGALKFRHLIPTKAEYDNCGEFNKSLINGMKMRAWIECTSLGALLIIPDLFVTIARNCCPQNTFSKPELSAPLNDRLLLPSPFKST